MGNAQTAALLLVRLVVGITMIAHGYNHWRGGGRIAGTARAGGIEITGWAGGGIALGAAVAAVAGMLAAFWRPQPKKQAGKADGAGEGEQVQF